MTHKKSRLADYQKPLWYDVANRFLKLPRLVRILFAGLFALAVTLAVSPLIDYVYLRYLYTEQTRLLPSLVSAVLGISMYGLGWWLVVGTVDEKPPARALILVYLILGVFAVCLVLTLALTGFSSAIAPTA